MVPIMMSRAWQTAQPFLLQKVTVVNALLWRVDAQKCQLDVRPVNFANGKQTSDGNTVREFHVILGVNSSRRPRPAFEVDNLALDGSKYDRGPCVPENPHLGDDDVWFFWIQ
jgi:hypothetical protein